MRKLIILSAVALLLLGMVFAQENISGNDTIGDTDIENETIDADDNGTVAADNDTFVIEVLTNETNATDNETEIDNDALETDNTIQASGDLEVENQKFNHVVLKCDIPNATRYDWDFGDGDTLKGIFNQAVFHIFRVTGLRTVVCANADTNETASVTVDVNTTIAQDPSENTRNVSANISIAPFYPKGNDFVFVCEGNNFDPIAFTWDFGDGSKQVLSTNQDVFHRYSEPGTYNVSCEAADDENVATVTIQATASGTANQTGQDETPAPEANETGDNVSNLSKIVELRIAEQFGNDVILACDANGIMAEAYTWEFGDGQKLVAIPNDNVYHSYGNGTFNASCEVITDEVIDEANLRDNLTLHLGVFAFDNGTVSGNETLNETGNATGNATVPVGNETGTGDESVNETENNETITIDAILDGSLEVPPVETDASGEARATLDGDRLTIEGSYSGLSSNLLENGSGHVHIGEIGVAGPIVFPLEVEDGEFSLDVVLNETSREELLDGLYYINIHSELHPAGEIRGQLLLNTT